MEKETFGYSKVGTLLFTVLPLGMILLSLSSLIKFIDLHQTTNWLLILLFDLCFLVMLIFIVIKMLIPMLQGRIALEISSIGITSYVKNVVIKWDEIENLEFRSGQTSSSLYIALNCQTDRGNHVRIALTSIEGNDFKIYTTVKECFERSKLR